MNASNDPYGIYEAEELGGTSKRLLKCSQSEACPEYAEALFWVAADMLTSVSADEHEIDGKDFGLTKDMSVEEILKILEVELEWINDPSTPKYKLEKFKFKRGLTVMQKSHEAGSANASNELGLLYMEQVQMQNLYLAEDYFKTSLNRGDSLAAYNLARLVRMQNPNSATQILAYLKQAASKGRPDMEIMYMLGLEAFGNEAERQKVLVEIKKNKVDISNLREDFEYHFNLAVPQ